MESTALSEPDFDIPLGYLVCRDGLDVDALLAGFARSLRDQGWRVGGIVQRKSPDAGGAPTMVVEDLRTGDIINIRQDLGRGSESCHLDPAGIVAASLVVQRAIDDGCDLVIINRFGKLESTGSGLLSEFNRAASEAVPMLTAVARTMVEPWTRFCGGYGTAITPDPGALQAWWHSVTAGRDRPRSATGR
ncbi:MAG: DUF2478 domain-containing protein [Azospirillaceae bacterium]|nr:DUF2478 domain-containing protein [Azospirillaceae bacterium]